MKFLIFIFTLACTLNANAGLITTQSDKDNYSAGDTILVDFYVNNLNEEVNDLQVEFNFDDALFEFVDFSWIDSDAVWDFFAFGGAFLYDIDLLNVYVFGLDGPLDSDSITDVVGSSFKLGSVEFTALSDSASPNLTVANTVAQDYYFNDVAAQAVPEPSTTALFALVAGLMFMRNRKQS